MLDDSDSQSRALHRVRTRPQFVEENEALTVSLLQNFYLSSPGGS